LISEGSYDIFIAKLNAEGNVVWAKSAGGTDKDEGFGICVDNDGNIYITGGFENSAKFDETHTLNSAGQTDFFIAKYDPSGNVVWAKKAGGTGADGGYGIAADSNNDIIVIGKKSGAVTFGLYTLSNFEAFTVKYNTDGNVVWAREINLSLNYAISVDNSNNIYLIGRFAAAAIPGSISYDIYLAKYNSLGTFQWSVVTDSYTLSDSDVYKNALTSIDCDNAGNVYITGLSNSRDVFISKYSSAGASLWNNPVSGPQGYDMGGGIKVDDANIIHVIGHFAASTLTFDTGVELNNYSYTDLFYARYNSNGEIIDTRGYEGAVDDYSSSICVVGSDYIYLTGYANSRFLTLDYFTIESMGRNDLVIAKIKQ